MMIFLSKICSECDGEGVVTVEVTKLMPQNYDRFAEPDYVEEEVECEECEGYGWISKEDL